MDASTILRSIDLVWPATTGSTNPQNSTRAAELQVKHAVAAYLAISCNYRASSSDVAEHTRERIGSVKQLGINKSFRQLLAEDPCFQLEDPHASEAHIVLNVQLVLQLGSAVQQQQQQQQQRSAVQQQQQQQVLKCIDLIWQVWIERESRQGGTRTAELRVQHAAAAYLATCRNFRAFSSSIASHVAIRVGSVGKLGIGKSFKQIMTEDTCFVLENTRSSEAYIELDVQQVIQRGSLVQTALPQQRQQQWQQKQQQQERQQQAAITKHGSSCSLDITSSDDDDQPSTPLTTLLSSPPRHAAATAASHCSSQAAVSAQQLLHFVFRHQWHSSNAQLGTVRRALAVHLVQQANTAALARPVTQVIAAGDIDPPASDDATKYRLTSPKAGVVMLEAWRKCYQGQERCYNNIKEALAGDRYLSTVMTGKSEQSVQLEIAQLLQDVAADNGCKSHPSVNNDGNSNTLIGSSSTEGVSALKRAASTGATTVAAPWQPVVSEGPTAAASIPAASAAASSSSGSMAVVEKQQQQQQHKNVLPSNGKTAVTMVPGKTSCSQCNSSGATPAVAAPATGKKHFGPPESFQPVFGANPGTGVTAAAAAAVNNKATAGPVGVLLNCPSGSQVPGADHCWPLQLLGEVSANVCRAATVWQMAPHHQHHQQQQHQSQSVCSISRAVHHMLEAKLAAWDFTVTGLSDKHSSAAITSVHVFVPPVGLIPAALYVLDLTPASPAGQSPAAAQQTMRQLQPVLGSRHVLNVFHDVRLVSILLQQQFGISLSRPLDTQLLAGITALAANTAGSSSSSSSSNGHSSWTTSADDISRKDLHQLLGKYGFPVKLGGDGVRYLLLLAQQLLQQVPDILLALGDLQVLLAQQQQQNASSSPSSLQLQSQLVPGYGPLINQHEGAGARLGSSSSSLAGAAASRSGSGLTVSGGTLHSLGSSGLTPSQAGPSGQLAAQGLLQVCFELKVQHQAAGGWFRSRYDVYLNDSHHTASTPPAAAAVAQRAAASPGRAAESAVPDQSAAAVTDHDEAVLSMTWLLPERLRSYLQPYSSRQQQPALMEVFIDTSDFVKLRLGDKSVIELDIRIGITEALAHLAAAKQLGRQQGGAAWSAASGNYDHSVLEPSASSYGGSSSSKPGGDAAFTPAGASTESKGGFFGLFGSRRNASSSGSATEQPGTAAAATMQAAAASAAAAVLETVGDAVSSTDTAKLAAACGFGSDNRMGVPGTLHRIAAIRDKQGAGVTGLTYRIGRDVRGVARPLADILSSCKASLDPASGADRPRCVLLLGRPGVGKTTLLRNVAYLLSMPAAAGGLGLSVVIVDTSNEIAGDSDERHPCIGTSRRMMVRRREDQADVLIEAVQNHTPDVIIVDEIGTRKEVEAAKTIAQRGVVLIATAHGNTLGDLMRNPTLRDLVGGVAAVTLGDVAAKSNSGRKTRIERAGAATFNTLVELRTKQEWCLHLDVEKSVDTMLRTGLLDTNDREDGCEISIQQAASSRTGIIQTRSITGSGSVLVHFDSTSAAHKALSAAAVVDTLAGKAVSAESWGVPTASSSSAGQVVLGSQGTEGAGSRGATQSNRSGKGFSGAWLIDLMHAAAHRAIVYAVEGEGKS